MPERRGQSDMPRHLRSPGLGALISQEHANFIRRPRKPFDNVAFHTQLETPKHRFSFNLEMSDTMNRKPTLFRHGLVLGLSGLAGYLLLDSRAEWSEMHRYNRALGDLSLLLIAMAMALGPLARLSTARLIRKLLPYRRELGIYAVLAAIVHTIIILFGWVELDFARLFGFEYHPTLQRYVMVQHGFALGNILGIAALLYGIVLAATSNDFSQNRLGASVWKYIQQGTYVLWWLTVLHTAYFLFIHFLDFHRRTPEPNWAQWPFMALVGAILALQLAATIKTWRAQRHRRAAT